MSIGLAGELDSALKSAGWSTNGVSYATYASSTPVGVFLSVRSKEALPRHAIILQKALAVVGIEAPATFDGKLTAAYVGLIVGRKT